MEELPAPNQGLVTEKGDYWLIGNDQSLEGWQDYWRYFPQVWKILSGSPYFIGYVIVVIVESVLPKGAVKTMFDIGLIPGFGMVVSLMLGQFFIKGFLEASTPGAVTIDAKPAGNFIGINIIYTLLGFLMACLFVIPGFWWLTKSCVAPIVVLAENRSCFSACQRSHELMTGHFWAAIRYLSVPIGLEVAAVLVSAIPIFMLTLMKVPTMPVNILSSALGAAVGVLSFAVMPLLVRLYFVIKPSES